MGTNSRWKARAGQFIVTVLVVIFTVVPGARPVAACTCSLDTTGLAEIFAKPDTTAFIGRVASVSDPDASATGEVTVTFTVERTLKGYAASTIKVRTRATDAQCGVKYPLDMSLGVTLAGTDESAFTASLCTPYSYTTDVNAFSTWSSMTLPPPTGSGRIAGFGFLGPETYGVVDEQMRVLGYVPMPKPATLDVCPGDGYVAGLALIGEDAGKIIRQLVSVNLTTLATTRLPIENASEAWCLDAAGRMLVEQTSSETGSFSTLLIISRSGDRQQVPLVSGATDFLGPTLGRDALVWLTDAEAVVTDLNGSVLKRISAPKADFDNRYMYDGRLLLASSTSGYTLVDVMTGARNTVPNLIDWTYVNQRLWKLTNPTTLEVVDTATGQSSQVPIANGPTEEGWKLAAGRDILQLVKDGADVFYVINAFGNATSYPATGQVDARTSWGGNAVFVVGDAGDAWVVSQGGRQRVLEPYGPGLIERIDGPVLSAGACGTTAIPTLNYVCEPPTLPPTL